MKKYFIGLSFKKNDIIKRENRYFHQEIKNEQNQGWQFKLGTLTPQFNDFPLALDFVQAVNSIHGFSLDFVFFTQSRDFPCFKEEIF